MPDPPEDINWQQALAWMVKNGVPLSFNIDLATEISPEQEAKVVSTAGTPEPLSGVSKFVSQVLIQAKDSNTGKVYIGKSTVSSTNGVELTAGESVPFVANVGAKIDLNKLYIDVDTDGEGVKIIYWS